MYSWLHMIATNLGCLLQFTSRLCKSGCSPHQPTPTQTLNTTLLRCSLSRLISLTWQWQSISSPLLWSILENTFALGSVASNYQSYLRNPLVCLQVSKYQSCLLALLIFVALKLQQHFCSFPDLKQISHKKLARHFVGSTPLICPEIYHPRHFARRAEACGKGAFWEVGFVRVGEWNKGGLAEVFGGWGWWSWTGG